jgi:putative ABC transport system permease protein
VPAGLRDPVTKVVFGNQVASIGGANGAQSDLLAIDPSTFGAVIHWFPDWGADPRQHLDRLRGSPAVPLPVIVTGLVPATATAIWVQGIRVPVRVVARVTAFPGMSAGIPLIAASLDALNHAAAQAHLYNPLGTPLAYVWAKGPPAEAASVLEAPPLTASFVTTIRSFTDDPGVLLAKRTFAYMRLIAIAAGVLVLVGLLLYLQARQRAQAVSSALAGRMGLRRRTEVLSLTLELGAIGLLAGAVGGLVALLTISPIVGHIDPLPDNPPAPILVLPLGAIVVAAIALALLVSLAALVTSWTARRIDMGEALRVV